MKQRSALLALVVATLLALGLPTAVPAGVYRITNDSTDNRLRAGLGTLFWEHGGNLVRYVDTPARDYVMVRPATSVESSAEVGSYLFFATWYDVWMTDGTEAGTANVFTQPSWNFGPTVAGLRELNGNVLFGVHAQLVGWEPWKVSGTGTGAAMIEDLFPGPDYGFSRPTDMAILNGQGFFMGDDGVNGEELWVTNGSSAAGTSLLLDIWPGDGVSQPHSSAPHTFVTCGPNVYFVADDGVHGNELWMTGGTAGSTLQAADIYPDANGSGILEMTCVGSRLFVWASNTPSGGEELWLYDPTAIPAARLLKGSWNCDLNQYFCGPQTNTFRAVGDLLLFAAGDNAGVELWKSDGTPEGTVMVKDLWPGLDYSTGSPYPFSSDPYSTEVKDGKLYFRASHPDFGGEVWVSDGTAAGTWPVTDVVPGPGDSWPDELTSAGRFLFFRVTGDDSYNVWAFDPADTPPYRDLVVDGSFESNPTPAKWARLGLVAGKDLRVCNQRSLEKCSFKIAGSTTAVKGLRQTILRSGDLGDANEVISLSGWSKSQGVPATGGVYGLELLVSYKDGTSAKKLVTFARGTHAWQYRRVQLKATKPWFKATITARHERLGGTVWFDDLRLTAR